MNTLSTKKILPYTHQEMYALVNSIETYPEFLSWCTQSIIHERTEEELKATLTMSAKGFTQSITTHNHMQKDKMIEMRLVEGPLKHFESFWRFEQVENSSEATPQCQILFDIAFEFSNRFIRMMLEPFFNKVADTIVDEFSTRAAELYKR